MSIACTVLVYRKDNKDVKLKHIKRMNKKGKILTKFIIRIFGALIGAIGFLLLAYQKPILGTALIGIGSLLIAVGEG